MACSSYSSIFGNPNSAILSPRSPCSHTFSPKFSSISFNSHPSLSFRFNQFATPHYSRIHHRYHRSNFVVMTFAGNSKPLRTMISGAPASGKGIQSELITEKMLNDRDIDYVDGDGKGRRRTWKRRRKSDRRVKQKRWRTGEDEEDDEMERGVWKEVVDSLWIFQVFRAYGWFSPIILLSFLIATGPKAFLMAFSIPLGLSLLIFAYQKLQGSLEGSPKLWNRRKRSNISHKSFMEEGEDEDEESYESQRNKKRDHQSWVNKSNGSLYKSQNGSGVSGNNFGGWDDLVRADETQRAQPSQEIVKQERMEKFSRLLQEKDMPLNLRLLIAVFPFLASWTNLL